MMRSRKMASLAAYALLLVAVACQSPAPFVPPEVEVVTFATPTATAPAATHLAQARPKQTSSPSALPTDVIPTATKNMPTATLTPEIEPSPTPASTSIPEAEATATAEPVPATAAPVKPSTATPFLTSTPLPESTAVPTELPTPKPTPSPTAQPPDLDINGSLTYVDIDGILWSINADGSEKTLIAESLTPSQAPVWSAKKRRVAFRQQKTINNAPVNVWRVMEVDDLGKYKLIARLQDSENFTWSPDGRTAITSEPFKGFVEYNISTQRSEDVFDTFGATLDRSPELSPNGKKLAFVHYELSVQYYVGLIRDYDDEIKPITYDGAFIDYFHPTVKFLDAGTSVQRNQQFMFMWTPDSKQIVYAVRQPQEAFGSIYITGAKFATIATGVMEPVGTNVDLSANGETVVFAKSEGLMTSRVDGRFSASLLLEGTAIFPRWSPDEKYVAFTNQQGIVMVSADGKVKHAIPSTAGAVSVAWVPLP